MYFTDVNSILFILCISVWFKLSETVQIEAYYYIFKKYLKYMYTYTLHFQKRNILEYSTTYGPYWITFYFNSYL